MVKLIYYFSLEAEKMKRVPFEPPSDHYDERIEAIDEEICQLIKRRKDVSNNNPGFPNKRLIKCWSKKYNFYEDFLNSIFSSFLHEEMYKPVVEPKEFLRNIPILKSVEKDDTFYSVTFIRQFKNASVVHLNIDRNITHEMDDWHHREHTYFELSIQREGAHHDCRNEGGGGSRGNETFTFIVSPALPDDISRFNLVFTEYKIPFQKHTGFEFTI